MCDRQYYPIWSRLKALAPKLAETQGISVSAPRALHKRIAKAVRKEKWLDLGYKILIQPKYARLTTSRSGGILTFYLKLFDSEKEAREYSVDDF